MKKLLFAIFALLCANLSAQNDELTQKDNEAVMAVGTELNKAYTKAMDRIKASEEEYNRIVSDLQTGREKIAKESLEEQQKFAEGIKNRIEAWNNSNVALYKSILEENKDNVIPALLMRNAMRYAGLDFLEEYLKTYKYIDRPSVQTALKQINGEKVKAIGSKVIDFVMDDLSGKSVHLTDWVGKGNYVLVDFWASWCGPCRQEMPNVKAAYAKYHPKGFEIVGVSFDRAKDAWEKGVADLALPWPQMSDLKYWECEAAKLYNIHAIPATILFDPEGKVAANNLRGEELVKKLAEIYGE